MRPFLALTMCECGQGHRSGHKYLLDYIEVSPFSYLLLASFHVKIFHQTGTAEAKDLQQVPPLLAAKSLSSLATACMDGLLRETGQL